MILGELAAMSGLDHPGVVCMKEYFVHGGRVYMIMELLEGAGGRRALSTFGVRAPPVPVSTRGVRG